MKAVHKIVASVAGAALLVVLVVASSFWSFRQTEEAAATRTHTYDLIVRANAFLSEMRDAEIGQRGYALTGDEAFLAPYLAVKDGIRSHLEIMRQGTRITAAQERLDAMSPLVDAKMAELARVIELSRRHDMLAVMATVGSGQGKRLMDSIRTETGSYIRIEDAALLRNEADYQATMRRLYAFIAVASLMTLLFALSLAWFIYRETQQRLKNLVHLETRHLLDLQEETTRKLQDANAILQDSEEKLAVTLYSIGDAVIATDATGRVTRLNPLAEKLTGWSQEAAGGRPVDEIFQIINQETRQPSAVPVIETLAHGTVQGLANHTLLIARDGSERAIADSCSPIRDRDGQVTGAVLIFRDVTDEYAAQQALRDSSALIQTILNTVADGVITLQARGRVIETVNPAAEGMFGYGAAELVGQNISLLIPELDREQQDASLAFYGASDQARAIGVGREFQGRRKDGSVFPMEMAVSEMWLGGQRYFTGLLRDISTRKQAEAVQEVLDQRLRDHQLYTRSLFEANIDALTTTDPSGIITDVNKQMEALTACSRAELIGAPFKNYFADPTQAEAGIRRVLSEKNVTDFELRIRAAEAAEESVVSCNAATFYDSKGNLQGVFVAARDVTERKRLDRVLHEKNLELEEARSVADKANLAKSDFLSSMSHELRTPLNAILGFAQLMESGTPPPTPTQKRNLEQILTAGWYLLELINEILDLALIESGKVTLSREPVSLAEVMLECRAMIAPQAQKRGIRMSFPRFEMPYFVKADRTRMKQVLINLLFNAIKYNRTDGTVVVEYALMHPDTIRIGVRDTGAGLAPQQLAQLFQPFNRLGKETGAEEGTGIGLVVTKRLVELMGGSIGVDSKVGTGSVFWIELSLTTAPQLTTRETEHASLTRGQLEDGTPLRTLLYVEDNPANLELVEQLVARRPDLRLLSAADGNLGIEFARAYQPEVILMDINLPGISGIDAMRILAADPTTAHIPIIALSANAVPHDIAKALEAGFFNYLTKPIKVHEFMDALDVALKSAESALKAKKEPA